MKLVFEKNIDELDTFESFFGQIEKNKSNLIIPYLNLGISNHELNPSKKIQYIDYAYIIAQELLFFKIDQIVVVNKLNDKYNYKESVFLGGESLIENQKVYDIELQAKHIFLQINENYQIREEPWLPVDTPKYPKNMDFDKVDQFIYNRSIPENVKKYLL
ncbi:hypothetical protein [Edaphocola flava]|uniref:hypothetical protein n=1 Tax=Edaphocola flava TaxID=2499629 RepID=UPI00100A9DC4|nr:hypothetical protein [Edaphocola flava]